MVCVGIRLFLSSGGGRCDELSALFAPATLSSVARYVRFFRTVAGDPVGDSIVVKDVFHAGLS